MSGNSSNGGSDSGEIGAGGVDAGAGSDGGAIVGAATGGASEGRRGFRRKMTINRTPIAAITARITISPPTAKGPRSEEHTSELQSQSNIVCRLLLEKKKLKWEQG